MASPGEAPARVGGAALAALHRHHHVAEPVAQPDQQAAVEQEVDRGGERLRAHGRVGVGGGAVGIAVAPIRPALLAAAGGGGVVVVRVERGARGERPGCAPIAGAQSAGAHIRKRGAGGARAHKRDEDLHRIRRRSPRPHPEWAEVAGAAGARGHAGGQRVGAQLGVGRGGGELVQGPRRQIHHQQAAFIRRERDVAEAGLAHQVRHARVEVLALVVRRHARGRAGDSEGECGRVCKDWI